MDLTLDFQMNCNDIYIYIFLQYNLLETNILANNYILKSLKMKSHTEAAVIGTTQKCYNKYKC